MVFTRDEAFTRTLEAQKKRNTKQTLDSGRTHYRACYFGCLEGFKVSVGTAYNGIEKQLWH